MKAKMTLSLIGLLIPLIAISQWTQLGDTFVGNEEQLNLGYAINLSADGTTLAIGEPLQKGSSYEGNEKSRVKIYRWNTNAGTWLQLGQTIFGAEHFLAPPNNHSTPPPNNGSDVILTPDGNTIAMVERGYYYINPNDESDIIFNDRIRVFKYQNSQWEQIGEDILGEARNIAIADNGNILAVGIDYDDTVAENSGAVKVYQYQSNAWTQLGNTLYGYEDLDYFGTSVDLSGDGSILAVGCSGCAAGGLTPDPGYVRIYNLQANTWTEQETIAGLYTDFYGHGGSTGSSVALSNNGEVVVIGSQHHRDSNNNLTGAIRVFKDTNGNWAQVGQTLEGGKSYNENTKNMVSISDDGNIIAFGTSESVFSANLSSVKVFQNTNNNWQQIGQAIHQSSEKEKRQFGQVVSLSADGNILGIGISGAQVQEIQNAGTVKVYQNCNLTNISTSFSGNTAICTGNNTHISAIIDQEHYQERGVINWYDSLTADSPLHTGDNYQTSELSESTSYWVEAVSPTGCPSERIEVNITVNPVPQLNVQNTVIDVCNGAKATLYATTDIGTLQWYKNLEDSQPIATGNTFNSPALTQDTTYWVEAISDENCNSERTAINVFVNDNIQPNIVFNYNNSYCPDGTKAMPTLEQYFYPGGAFSAKNGIIIDPITGEIDVENSTPGNYSITYTVEEDLEACITAKKHTQEVVIRPCFVQRGISPNGDGINDNFDLRGIQAQKVNIFNRYGTEVYSFNGNYTNQWDGKDNNGKQLPDATYFYTIFTKNGEKLTGWVYINKQF
ncbi:gliding motility-associated-like protein [Mesonia hippocampi]|uniref:Gliding motility-associated-like protein n=1 Tax=Mesonia hippocampi TaxID=1628250 RepID=A0A840EMB2_9FLAO|nr:gliding motility-associated C-terminal domain-containing protein [Mesonia hippocampi]MBB4118255.1 gliding motility-associated-like protein [Mesonia hippocampi]